MEKRITIFIIMVMMVFGLSACSSSTNVESNKNKRQDKIEIYDNNSKILETTDQNLLDYFSEKVSITLEKSEEEIDEKFFKKLPNDADISYHYVFSSKRPDNEGTKIDFYVYSNYPYITLKGIPLVGSLTWELPEEENLKLQNPKDIEKINK